MTDSEPSARPVPPVIAIDGPAGSGKSTVARMVADRLRIAHLDTGAMYRAVTARALAEGVAPSDADRLAAIAARMDIGFTPEGMRIDGRPVGGEIRTPAVTTAVSEVSAHPAVRAALVAVQRQIMGEGRIVAEGRDIGTVVFPDATVKVFLTASIEERARRRHAELLDAGHEQDEASLRADIARRDEHDGSRAHSPLRAADDAVLLDTTDLTPEQVVDAIVALVEARA